jgi:hypothetical protein
MNVKVNELSRGVLQMACWGFWESYEDLIVCDKVPAQ